MSSPGPLPESSRRRRTWLWILIGIVLAILLCCCAAIIWASTVGEDTVNGWTTRIARELTQTSGTEEAGE